MFAVPPRTTKKITLDEDFAELVDVSSEGNLTFQITYGINQSEVITSGVSTIKVSIYATRKREVSIFENKKGQRATTAEIIANIQGLQRTYRSIAKSNEQNLLAQAISDATSRVNNQIVALIRSPAFKRTQNYTSRITQLHKTKIFLKEVAAVENDEDLEHPILQTNRNTLPDIDYQSTVKQSIKSMLLKKSVDPSSVVNLSKDRVSAIANLRGVYIPPDRPTGYRWGDDGNADVVRQTFTQMVPNTTLKVTTSSAITTEKLIQVIETVPLDKIKVPVTVTISSEKMSSSRGAISTFFVRLDVVNKCGVIVDSIEQEIDVAFHLRMFNTPKIPPEVKFARYDTFSKGTLQIFQQDPKATSVRVYKKFVSHVSTELDDYVLVGEFSVAKGAGFASVPIDISRKDTSVYRVIPVSSDGIPGYEFTNIIINPPGGNNIKYRYVSLTSKIVENGIALDVRELPPDVVAFRILRKNKTIFESTPTTVGDDVIYVDRSQDDQVYTIVDNQVKSDNAYEYTVDLIYRNGTSDNAGYALVEYLPLVENLVDTRIVDLQTSTDPINPDVTFRIESKLVDSNLDVVKNLLEKQGMSQYFFDNILNERDKLKKLIAHQVTRVNLTTGQRESFGVVTSEFFTDSELGKINSVQPLKSGYRYRYDVNTLLRAPETLFESIDKSAVDPVTKKPYSYKPSKFFHPITLKKGNILEREAQLSRYAKDDMSFGNVGDLVSTEVSFAQEQLTLTDVRAFKYDRHHVLLQWTVDGASNLIENFIIVLEENGMSVPIGKVHAIDEKRKYEFIHTLSSNDVGNYVYNIVPVFSNYSMGSEVKSNAVVVTQ
jgi:hypothetical protein